MANFNGTIHNEKAQGTLTIAGPIGSGVTSVTQNGAGTMTLSGVNSYTGPTNIMAGMLTISDASTFASTSAINLTGTGSLDVNVLNQSLAKLSGVPAWTTLRYSKAQTTGGTGPGTIRGTVELNVNNVNPNYTLDFGQGSKLTNTVAAIYNSGITVSGDASIDTAGNLFTGTSMTIDSSNALTKTLTLTGTNTGANTIGGAISNTSGTIGVTKTGTGTWNLSGANTYTGATTVTAGTLGFAKQASLYNNGAAAAWSAGNIIVMPNSTLALRVGGAGEFIAADVATLAGLGTATGGFMNGSTLALDTTGGSFAYGAAIANPNGGANALGLTKQGAGNLTLSGANTFSGATTVSAGTLTLTNNLALQNSALTTSTAGVTLSGVTTPTFGGLNGSTALVSAITGYGNVTALTLNPLSGTANYSGVISNGSGNMPLTKTGAGTQTLNGSAVNTYTGPTYLLMGTLVVSSFNSVVGGTASSSLGAPKTVADGTIVLDPYSPTVTLKYAGAGETTDRMINTKASHLIINQSGSGLLKFTGDMAGSKADATFTFQGSSSTGTGEFAGTIGGTMAVKIVKSGTGTWTLSGANVYSGTTTINAGTLSVSSINRVAGGTTSSNLGAPPISANGTIAMGSSGNTGKLLYTGAGETTDRVIRLAGTTGGAIIDQSGTSLLKFTSDMTATGAGIKTLTLQGSTAGTGEIAAAIVDNSGTNKTSVTKTGTGTWTLSGANTYTGLTTVNDGTLLINSPGSLAGAVKVDGGKLGGDGFISGTVTVNAGGTLAPGASPGTLTIDSDLTMAADSIYEWQLGSTVADMVDVNGTLSIPSSWALKLSNDGGTLGSEYTLFTYDSFTDTLTAPTINYGSTGWSGATVALDTGGKRVYLKFGTPGDTNSDGVVDAADFITLKKNFGAGVGGAGVTAGDFDKTGTVDWADLGILMNNMVPGGGGAPSTAPEPCSAMLLMFGAAALLRRRRS